MQLLALGLNHTTAPLAVRERVAFSPDEITDTIAHLLERCGAASQGGIHEAAVLSTCNRTELYTACEDPAAARASVLSYIANKRGSALGTRTAYLRFPTGRSCPPHFPRRLGP